MHPKKCHLFIKGKLTLTRNKTIVELNELTAVDRFQTSDIVYFMPTGETFTKIEKELLVSEIGKYSFMN